MAKTIKINCIFCQGRGIQPGADRVSCVVCRGKGRIRVSQPYHPCKECGGQGKKPGATLYCFLCRGKGVIETAPAAKKKIKKKTGKRKLAKKKPQKARRKKLAKKKKAKKSFFKKFLKPRKIHAKRRKK